MSDPKGFYIYKKLPVWMQNCACSIAGIEMRRKRYNKAFYNALDFLEKSQQWSLEELRFYQNEQLQKIILHAYNTVPYYNQLFHNLNLTPDDIKTVDDLSKLPVLERETVRKRFHEFQSRNWPQKRIVYGYTGGTTGAALTITSDIDTAPWQWAIWWRHRRRFALKLNDPFIAFAGRTVIPLEKLTPPFWRRNLPMHQTYVSIHHMTKQNMPYLVDYLQKRKVVYYSGYPSALYLLASWLLENNISLQYPPRITVTGAETVLPHQRAVIEKAFKTKLADQYGASEHCGNISECQYHTYHIDMEFGVIELLEIDRELPNLRRIICTGFRNPVMPLVRYNIGDVATVSNKKCPCGRALPVVERIDGRIESYILTPDGRQLGRLDFLFKHSENIQEAQLIQNTQDRVTVRIVKNASYNEIDQAKLLTDMRKYLGDQIEIDVEYVPEIPREPNGKFRQIVSHVFYDKFRNANP